MSRMSNHAYGLAFIAIVTFLIGLSIAAFQKKFTDAVMVTLLTDRIGSQLQESSDVKIRGLIVGEVRSIETTGSGATLQLALQPEQVQNIPANVTARLLPKTLFGERFVDLVPPPGDAPGDAAGAAATEPIAAGATIGQDRTSVAIELEKVFEDLLPLLRTVEPAKLAATLNALATTLDGRGKRLGENLVLVDRYFRELNPKMPAIQADISGLADLASTYDEAAPDLIRMAKALVTTNTTIVEKQDELAGFFAGTAGFANTTARFLEANGDRLIEAGRVSRPTLEVFAKYAPEYPCLASGMANWIPVINDAWKDGQFHITLEVAAQREGYHPGEEPAWGERRAPDCHGLPNPPGSQANPKDGPHFDDGTDRPSSSPAPSAMPSAVPSALPSAFTGDAAAAIGNADSGLAGTVAAAAQRRPRQRRRPAGGGAR